MILGALGLFFFLLFSGTVSSFEGKVRVPPGAREILFSDQNGRPLELLRDEDGDGRFEVRVVYKDGIAFFQTRDVDGDGSYEEEILFDAKGLPKELRLDRNRDGKPDKWQFYRDGVPFLLREDEDFDGEVDLEAELGPQGRPRSLRRDKDGDGCFEHEEVFEGRQRILVVKKFEDPLSCKGPRIKSKLYYSGREPLKRLIDLDEDGVFEIEELFKDGKRCLLIKKDGKKTEVFLYRDGILYLGFEDLDGDGKFEREYDFQARSWNKLSGLEGLENLRRRCGL